MKNPEGFTTAIVRIPCEADRYAEKKLKRLALEVDLTFGHDARVETPTGGVVQPLKR